MEDKNKTKEQLVEELLKLRRQVTKQEKSKSDILRMERTLKESEEKYIALSNSLEVGIVLHAPDTSILLINPKASEILGLSQDQMKGKKAFDPEWKFVRQDKSDMPLEEYPINKVFRTKKPILNYVAGIKRPDRNYITWVNVNAVLVLDKNKSIKYALISFVDITERKQVEEELLAAHSEAHRLRRALDEVPAHVYMKDPQSCYVYANQSTLELFGTTAAELVGCGDSSFFPPETVAQLRQIDLRVLDGEQTAQEVDVHDADDRRHVYWEIKTPIYEDSERKVITGILGISTDITERKKAEEELQHSKKELQKLTEYIHDAIEVERTLVASELHDEVGQALTGLKMDLFMMKNKLSEGKIEIPVELQNMEKLLDDSVQNLRKIYSNLRPLLLDDFGIIETMKQFVVDFQEQSGIICTFYQESEELKLDDKRSIALYRVLQGTINNIKWHSLATEVNIKIEKKGPNLKLTIKDNGIGINEEQINSSESFGIIGMRERARYLGGELKIKGIPDKGTTIMLEIPLKQTVA